MFSTLCQNKVTHMILDFLETITERMEPNFGKKNNANFSRHHFGTLHIPNSKLIAASQNTLWSNLVSLLYENKQYL